MEYWLKCWTHYCDFSGRARRKEYWMFCLINFLFSFAVGFLLGMLGAVTVAQTFGRLFGIAAFLPGLGVGVRRLHDIGKSGWWMLINFVPVVGWIIFLLFMCSDSQAGTNAYGENPKS